MQHSSLTLDEYIPFRLAVASHAVSSLVSTAYIETYGLKISEWRIMAVLSEFGAAPQHFLMRYCGMDKITVSRALQGLEKKKVVRRTPHPSDGRSRQLRLTECGKELFERIAPHAKALELAVLKTLTPEEVANLRNFCKRIESAAIAALLSIGQIGP